MDKEKRHNAYMKRRPGEIRRARRWQMDNPEKVRHYKERFRQDKPMAHRYYNLKFKNKDKMRMTAEEFGSWYDNEPKKCFYCDIPLDQLRFNNQYFNYRGSYNLFTIDRKKPSGDYSLENIVLACPLCNLVKSNFFSADTMRELAQRYIKPRWQQEAGIEPSAITPDELQPKIGQERENTISRINKALEPAKLTICAITTDGHLELTEYGLANEYGDEIDIALLRGNE